MSDGVTILLTDGPRVDVTAVSRPLAKLLRCPLTDVTTALRKARGILYQGLDPGLAAGIQAILETSGQRVLSLPDAEVVELPRPKRITWADPVPEAFRVGIVYAEARVDVPWDQLWCLCIGVIKDAPPQASVARTPEFKQMMKLREPEERGMVRARLAQQILSQGAGDQLVSLFADPDKALAAGKKHKPLDFCLDVVLKSDDWYRLRISRSDFCFSTMGQGTAIENFQLLARRVAERAPGCRRTPPAERFLAGQTRESDLFSDLQQLEMYNRWYFQILRHAGQPPAPRGAANDGEEP